MIDVADIFLTSVRFWSVYRRNKPTIWRVACLLSLSGNPYSCVALDILIESTMNKGSKLKLGWLAIHNNEKQMSSSIRNVNNVNRVRTITHRHANSKQSIKRKHADSTRSNIKTDEQAVQDLCACITEFNCDSLKQMNKSLCSLQSVIPAFRSACR